MRNKKQKRETLLNEEIIPEYDHLFNGNEREKNGKKRRNGFCRKLIKMNFWQILVSTLLLIVQNAPIYVIPLVTAHIINIATQAVSSGMTDEILRTLMIDGIILAVVIVQNIPTTKLRYGIVSKMLRKNSVGIKSVLVRKLQSLSITYHKNMHTGRVQAKFIKDTESVDNFMHMVMQQFVSSILNVIIAVFISVYKNGLVALFFLLIVPVNVTLMYLGRSKQRKMYRDYRLKVEDMSAKLNTMMTMIPVTKSHGLETAEISRMDNSIENLASSGLKVDKTIASFSAMVYVVNAILKASCIIFCAILAIYGIIEVGDIILYESMFVQISAGITAIISSLPMLSSGLEAINSISEIMTAKDVEANLGKTIPPSIEGNIKFENVSYQYPDTGICAVNDFSFEVKKGECIAFVGSSGSGKSTVMNLIIGFMQPTSGNLFIDGKNITEYDLSKYRSHISVVPQSSILFPGTIRENITYGLNVYTEEQLNEVLEMANVKEFIDQLPKGLDSDVGELGEKLSGGQKQRITIARALIRNPKILILDEATSALDNISELHVQRAIARSIEGRTTFIVAHRLSTIRDADKIVVLEHGRCVESGTYSELMARKEKFYQLKLLSDIENKQVEKELA